MIHSVAPEVIVFTDLDDSLFQTRRKCDAEGLSAAAYSRQGDPLSFHTPQQRALLKLWEAATLIPVTGRSSEALSRVRSISWSSYRVVSHGAVILQHDGHPLKSWRAHIDSEIEPWHLRLMHVHDYIMQQVKVWEQTRSDQNIDPLRVRLVYEEDLPVYLSVKGPRSALAELKVELEPLWSTGIIHHNDRNMALLPSYTSKARAVSHLRDLLSRSQAVEPLFIGVGDSISDLDFLRQCHFALTPQKSQIHQELWL